MTTSAVPQLTHLGTWLHEPFLARASDPSAPGEGRHALGAFLTLRLVDRFRPNGDRPHPMALAYQVKATRDFLLDLHPQTPEVTHLLDVVRLADKVQPGGRRSLLWPPLLAYAYSLEQELRLPEALDVVETALALGDGTARTEEIAALLQRGRILRLLGHLDEAHDSYEAGRAKAVAAGDHHSGLLGRIGMSIIFRHRGNLAQSEKQLRQIIREASRSGDVDAEGRARHDLGVTLTHQRRAFEAVPQFFRAFELYDRPSDKLRALSDTGEALKVLGAFAAADDAFQIVLNANPSPQVCAATMEELLELSALRRNRVAFESWRRKLDGLDETLPAQVRADAQLALGKGYLIFGQPKKAKAHLETASALAERYSLNEVLFRAQEVLNNSAAPRTQDEPEPPNSWAQDGAVSEVAEKLHALRSA